MKLSKSKSLYLVILLGCLSVAFADYKHHQGNALTYRIDPIQTEGVLMVRNENNINQNLHINEEAYNDNGFVIPCD